MSSPKRNRVKEIFSEAFERQGAERIAYLDAACAGDAELRGEVEALLMAAANTEAMLGKTEETEPMPSAHLREHAGTMVGRYKLLQEIGEGGFGTVFLAEQSQPVRRQVALKIIKLGMDTRQVVARFEAERQALAIMDHPNIAKVFDAGATETGRPYFVMELVHGIPITEYCDRNSLGMRQRLELFVQTCQAVQHAHQKGIIHRDIKPSNVLVGLVDGRTVPKIIDFGIAKATNQRLTEKTVFTEFRQMIGTPQYMSPEQAEMSGIGIDTRSDIYSLGVLLYELLTGVTPFDARELRSKAYAEMQRIIREVEPPRPSTRLSTMGEGLASVAAHRRADPRKLRKMVEGELDWIVMRTLEKDPARRYETANGLGADVQRFLAGEAVTAAPASRVYRLRKFARRNKGVLVTTALVAIALLAGTGVSIWQAVRASHAQDHSEANERRAIDETNAKEAALRQAIANAKRSEGVLKFLVETFRSPVPERDGRTVTVVDVLGTAVQRLKLNFAEDPQMQAALQEAIGDTYRGLGLYQEAIPLLEKSRDLRMVGLGQRNPITLESMDRLALAYEEASDFARAILLWEEVLPLRVEILGARKRDTLITMDNLGTAYLRAGNFKKALELHSQALLVFREEFGLNDADTLSCMCNLALAHIRLNEYAEALPLLEEAIKRFDIIHGENSAIAVSSASNLGIVYQCLLRFDDALRTQLHAVEMMTKKFSPTHPRTLLARNNLANIYSLMNRHPDAIREFEDVLKLQRVNPGPNHPDTLATMSNLALNYKQVNRLDTAIELGEETVGRMKLVLEKNHPDYLSAVGNLGSMYRAARQLPKAMLLFQECLNGRMAKFGPTALATIKTRIDIGDTYRAQEDFKNALSTYLEILAVEKGGTKLEDSQRLITMGRAGSIYLRMGQYAEGIAYYEKAYEGWKIVSGTSDPETLNSLNSLGHAYWVAKQYDRSVPIYEKSLEMHKAQFASDDVRTLSVTADLAINYRDSGAIEKAVSVFERLVEGAGQDPRFNWVKGELEATRSRIDQNKRQLPGHPVKPEAQTSPSK